MNPIILIPARMNATRLPGKPLLDIAGKPMILHVWERAAESGAGEVVVATDTAEIAWVVEKAGGRAIMTRPDHGSGSDRVHEALEQIDPDGRYDAVINLQGDMPTIDPSIIRAAADPLSDPLADIATLAAEIKDEAEKTDPSVVKVAFASPMTEDGDWLPDTRFATARRAIYFSRAAIPTGDGPLYHHIGIYAYRRAALERFVTLPPSPLEKRERLEQLRALEAGMRIDVSVVDTVPLGVDTAETLEKARKVLG